MKPYEKMSFKELADVVMVDVAAARRRGIALLPSTKIAALLIVQIVDFLSGPDGAVALALARPNVIDLRAGRRRRRRRVAR